MKQHYVPEIYLKRFSINNNGDFYQLRIKPIGVKSTIKKVNASSVCFEIDKYRMRDLKNFYDDSIVDANYTEKNVFDYEKKLLTKIFNKFDEKNNYIKVKQSPCLVLFLA